MLGLVPALLTILESPNIGGEATVVEELEVLASNLPNSGAAVTVCGVVWLTGWEKTEPELETWLNSPGLGSAAVVGGGPNSGFTWVVGRPWPNIELGVVEEAGACWPN